MSRLHSLDAVSLDLSVNGKQIEQVSTFPLLGTQVHQNLKWNNEINSKISICYRTLVVVRKLKHLAPFAVRKQLSECLIGASPTVMWLTEASAMHYGAYVHGTFLQ